MAIPPPSEVANAIQTHAFDCLGGRRCGPVSLADWQSDNQSVSGKLVFSWPIEGLAAELEREAGQVIGELTGLPASLHVSWKTLGPPTPPLGNQPKVCNLLAVASAKGGVGKSTLAVNLALALRRRGAAVGLLDADIQGPNVPLLLGLDTKIQPKTEGEGDQRLMIPVPHAGIHTLSMGMLAAEKAAVIWRGPMVSGALRQLMLRTNWGELDYLIVDMPPGTGDISLTLVQSVPLSAALLVSTADAMARADTERGAAMFKKLRVPLLGLVENMSYWQCPGCEKQYELFGNSEAAGAAMDIPVIGSVPLMPPTANGLAHMLTDGDSPAAGHWQRLADAVAVALADSNDRSTLERPKILSQAP